ncbi:hypothetical protein DS745_13185 [Anaerobacillus alkaliphilus]|uniref:Uncharacterized protein n=1 Tax=Anaerobacillus alkaliphilus TaxID=1548597 RepID=A0A4V1LG99_9BACI|nr:hypothetical protein [Anaerobacillus alkaliphilus]RXI99831.1 hypothetical protein DS745_13185 [Anaerobacillus alkaliphilus]
MKNWKPFLIAVMIVPWFSIPLIGKRSFKRFFPAALIMSVVVVFESFLARNRTWWWVYKNLFPKTIGEIPLIIGPFFIGSLWVLKATFGKFSLFVLLNTIIHLLFSFPVMDLFKKMGIASTVRLKRYELLLLFFVKSILLYGSQFVIDKVRKTY